MIMDDEKIIELYWSRSESALRETETKYRSYLMTVARNILQDEEDAAECVNDALLAAWNTIPPSRPEMLQTYLGKLVRNSALDRWRRAKTEKRGNGNVTEALEELAELSDGASMEDAVIGRIDLSSLMREFLRSLREKDRRVFIKRYWYFMSVREISEDMGLTESNVRVTLHRCRKALKDRLDQGGFEL